MFSFLSNNCSICNYNINRESIYIYMGKGHVHRETVIFIINFCLSPPMLTFWPFFVLFPLLVQLILTVEHSGMRP